MTNFVKQYVLGDVVTLSQGLAINAKTKHLISNEGIPLLRITDLINGTFNQFIEKDLAPKKCIANYGEIIYTRTGQVGLVFNKFSGVVHNNCFKVTPNEEILEKDFLYWFLRQPKIRDYANSIANGSVQKDLDHTSFKSIEISIPDKPYQNKATTILNLLEEKILLNQKMNQILEDIAKAIFKSWFIDFDPVYAKVEGKPTRLPDEISDLFPDQFVDSELGEIPKGWKVKSLSEIANIEYGKNLPTNKLLASGYPVFGGNGQIGHYPEYLYEDEMTLVSCRGAASGKVLRSPPKCFVTNNSLIINHIKTNFPSQRYMEFYLEYSNPMNFATGSAQPQITIDNLKHLKMLVANIDLITLFQKNLEPFFQKSLLVQKEITVLSSLRETLLPKLISGELQIPDAKKILEEAEI